MHGAFLILRDNICGLTQRLLRLLPDGRLYFILVGRGLNQHLWTHHSAFSMR